MTRGHNIFRRFLAGFAVLAIVLLPTHTVQAQSVTNFTWTGASTENNHWSNPDNWDLGRVPNGTLDEATFGNVDDDKRTITVDMDTSLYRMYITATSGTKGYVFQAAAQETITFVNSDQRMKLETRDCNFDTVFDVDVHHTSSYCRIYPRTTTEIVFLRKLTGSFVAMQSAGNVRVHDALGVIYLTTNSRLIMDTAEAKTNVYSSTIRNTGDEVIKEGDGLVIFTGTKSYSADTLINEGRLDANTTITNSLFTVAGGALLAGTGTVGATTVENEGRLGAGTGGDLGTLTMQGLTLAAESVLQLRLGAPGDPHDSLHVAGDLVLDGFLDVTALAGFDEGTYTLMTYSGTLDDQGLQPGSMPGGFAYQIDTSTAGQVNLTVIPEPGTLALAGLVLLLAWVRRRR